MFNRATVSVSIQESAKVPKKVCQDWPRKLHCETALFVDKWFSGIDYDLKMFEATCYRQTREKLLQNLLYYRLAMRELEDSFLNQPKDCNERKLCFEERISPVCLIIVCFIC